jgi:hypothetical protein
MGRLSHPLLFLLARCTKNELIRQIEFLKAEIGVALCEAQSSQSRMRGAPTSGPSGSRQG